MHCNAIILFAPGMLQARMQHTSYSARYDNLFCIIVNDILQTFFCTLMDLGFCMLMDLFNFLHLHHLFCFAASGKAPPLHLHHLLLHDSVAGGGPAREAPGGACRVPAGEPPATRGSRSTTRDSRQLFWWCNSASAFCILR